MERFKHFLKDDDLSPEEQNVVLETALVFSKNPLAAKDALTGTSIGLLFEKQSLRTRVSSEVACANLGAHPLQLRGEELHFNRGETASDAVRVLSGYLQLLMGRVNKHSLLEQLRETDRLPIVNGLSDLFHPLQALADLLTLKQKWGSDLSGKTICYVGDGNNVCHSLMLAGAAQGLNIRVATPKDLAPDKKIVQLATQVAKEHGGSISLINDAAGGADGVDMLYTDVWVSMGAEGGDEHRAKLAGFQIDQELVSQASPEVIVLHCLPAHRGEEIAAQVIDGPNSQIIQQAHNRLPATMALFLFLIAPETCRKLI